MGFTESNTVEAYVRDLLAAVAFRPPHLGCFGLHEWAMVYRLDPEIERPFNETLPATGKDKCRDQAKQLLECLDLPEKIYQTRYVDLNQDRKSVV